MLETSLYRLSGLESLSTSYRLFEITGHIDPGPEYYAGVTRLVRQLSRKHKAPFTAIQRGDLMVLAAPDWVCDEMAEYHQLVLWVATLKPTGERIDIDFTICGDELDPIRLRFLDFMIQNPLFENHELWQPRAGDAFYYRKPADVFDGIELHEGVSVRTAPYPGGGFGVLLDVRSKLISTRPVGANPNPDHARRLKNSSCLYRMGEVWYAIKISGLGETVSAPVIFQDGRPVSLKAYLHASVNGPVPPSLLNLNGDGAVLTYRGSDTAQVKAAPAELCYEILDTHSGRGARHQRKTILPAFVRRRKIESFKHRFLKTIKMGNAALSLAETPAEAADRPFDLPDLIFGNDYKLHGAQRSGEPADAARYAKQRQILLEAADKGFYETSLLEPQTLVLPKSVMNAWGPAFVDDFIREVRKLYPSGQYAPKIIYFDDLNESVSARNQAEAILKLAEEGDLPRGDTAIMVHTVKGKARVQDELAALLVNELRNRYGVNASIFHSRIPGESYRHESRAEGARYVRRRDEKGRFSGYLTGAALNKVLLPNGKWPFVLSGELVSDLIVGIDVKHHTAALVLVADGGRVIRQSLRTSTKKEKLPANIVKEKLLELVREEAARLERLVQTITVHRDGRVWPTEIKGLQAACEELAEAGLIHADWSLSVFEIAKSSPSPLRLFEVRNRPGQKPFIDNPGMGSWIKLTESEGYVCTTGAPLLRQGTAKPLHVRRVYGDMDIRDALGDIFRLSCLSWTRPESCSRLPVSLKLCDTLLMDEGADHDADEILHANDDEKVQTA